ncbi:MAG: type II secretion system F family protein [Legionellales bacterium]|nr:type II secretion system F family protein [Legionellales bacterium]
MNAKKPAVKIVEFVWEGTNKNGAKVKGEINGTSIALIKAELRKQGILASKVKKKPTGLFAPAEKKITSRDLTVFTRQLATMIGAGIPLTQSFEIVGRGHENPSMQKLVIGIKNDIEAGCSLAEAFQKHPDHFNNLFCSLVYAGEQSGALESMLNRLALYKEKTESLKKKIKKALMYPIIVLVISLLVSAGLLIFVVPQFKEVFAGFGAELPALTQYVVVLSEWMQEYWYIFFGGVGAAVYAFMTAMKRSEKFAYAIDKYMLRAPIFGDLFNKAIIARYARTLSTTFAAGMPLVDALEAVAGAAGNRIFRDAIIQIRDKVTSGTQLQQAMRDSQLFPNMVIQMVAIGEESGALETMLTKVAEYYEELVDVAVDNLSTLIEPLVMVILAVIIGGMVVAMYLPIFQLGSVV